MSIPALRDAVAAAGGAPTQFTQVGLYRELITAWGGTPTQHTVIGLLKEAIETVGGEHTQHTYVGLLYELVEALGGTPTGHTPDELEAQVADLATLSVNLFTLDWEEDLFESDGVEVTEGDICDAGETTWVVAPGEGPQIEKPLGTGEDEFGAGTRLMAVPLAMVANGFTLYLTGTIDGIVENGDAGISAGVYVNIETDQAAKSATMYYEKGRGDVVQVGAVNLLPEEVQDEGYAEATGIPSRRTWVVSFDRHVFARYDDDPGQIALADDYETLDMPLPLPGDDLFLVIEIFAGPKGGTALEMDGVACRFTLHNLAAVAPALRPPTTGYGPEIILNGTFDEDVSSWNPVGGGTSEWDAGGGGRLKHTREVINDGARQLDFGIINVGKTYRFQATLIPGSVPNKARAVLDFQGGTVHTFDYDVDGGSIDVEIVADGSNMVLDLVQPAGAAGDFAYFDNISLRRVF